MRHKSEPRASLLNGPEMICWNARQSQNTFPYLVFWCCRWKHCLTPILLKKWLISLYSDSQFLFQFPTNLCINKGFPNSRLIKGKLKLEWPIRSLTTSYSCLCGMASLITLTSPPPDTYTPFLYNFTFLRETIWQKTAKQNVLIKCCRITQVHTMTSCQI